MAVIKINVTSDTVCPWCYVGRKQLVLAKQLWLTQYPADTFAITYLPYQLNPQWPRGPGSSTSKREYYVQKFGAARLDAIHAHVARAGAAVGIAFSFGGNTGNTRDSHRLVRLSRGYGQDVQDRTIDGLFATFFEKEGDITDYAVLKKVAVEAGIPEADFQKTIVDSDGCGAEVDEDVRKSVLQSVTGVPDFMIQDKYHLAGANDIETFIRTFERVRVDEGGK